jgi:hypothetical protein
MLSFYEATTDPVFPPFNFVESRFGSAVARTLKHPYDIVQVKVGDSHGGVLELEIAGRCSSNCTQVSFPDQVTIGFKKP